MGGGVLPRVLGGSGMDNAAGRRIPHLDMRRESVEWMEALGEY